LLWSSFGLRVPSQSAVRTSLRARFDQMVAGDRNGYSQPSARPSVRSSPYGRPTFRPDANRSAPSTSRPYSAFSRSRGDSPYRRGPAARGPAPPREPPPRQVNGAIGSASRRTNQPPSARPMEPTAKRPPPSRPEMAQPRTPPREAEEDWPPEDEFGDLGEDLPLDGEEPVEEGNEEGGEADEFPPDEYGFDEQEFPEGYDEAPAGEDPDFPPDDGEVPFDDEIPQDYADEFPPDDDFPPDEFPEENQALEEGFEEEFPEFEEDVDPNFDGGYPEDLPAEEDEFPAWDAEAEDFPDEAEEEANESQAPMREEDVPLEEVTEELREAVETSIKMKKILEQDAPDEPSKKRRRLANDGEEQRHMDPLKEDLLNKLGLRDDSVCRYVIEAAELDEVQAMMNENYRPRRVDPSKRNGKGRDEKSCAEQLNEKFIRLREKTLPSGSRLDAVSAFRFRSGLGEPEERKLRKLVYKDLRYVMDNYVKGESNIDDLIEMAKDSWPDPDKFMASAAPDKPGPTTVSRFNRLELLDPTCNALVVGDANLTFSLQLAEHRKALGDVGKVIATTFEKLDTLKERYKEIEDTVKLLQDLGAEVLHNVDCTRIGVDKRFLDMEEKFGSVYYNFPHAGAVRGFFDGHPFVRWRHENLMHLFFRALRNFVSPGGSVKVSSNSNAQGVRYSDIIGAALTNEFHHTETVPFTEWTLRNYLRSYGDKRDVHRRPGDGEIYKSQRTHLDMVYCFVYNPTGTVEAPRVRLPPTKWDLMASSEGALRNLSGDRKKRKVEELTQLFLSYVQGIHVG